MNKKIEQFFKDVADGHFDNDLDYLNKAIHNRVQQISAIKMFSFKEGDKVKFNSLTKPKYLAGAVGTVKKVNRSKIVVDLDAPAGKYYRNISTPPTLVEKVK